MGRKSIDKPRKALTDKTKAWVKGLILDLQDETLHELTLDDLARIAHKSKSTLYSYFSTKEEIYSTGVLLILEDLAYINTQDQIKGSDMEIALRSLLMSISQGLGGISIHFLEQLKNIYPEIWLDVMEFANAILQTLASLYKKGMENGSFRSFNIALLTELDRQFVLSVMTNTTPFRKQGISLEDLVSEYLELRLSALRVG